MQRALSFAPYLEAHAVAALTAANEKPGLKDARQLLRWLETTRPATFTERDIYTTMFGRDTSVAKERAADACRALEPYGYIRRIQGRVDSSAWEVRPELPRVLEVLDIANNKINSALEPLALSFGLVEPNTENLSDRPRSAPQNQLHSEAPALPALPAVDPLTEAARDAHLARYEPADPDEFYAEEPEPATEATPPTGGMAGQPEPDEKEPFDWEAFLASLAPAPDLSPAPEPPPPANDDGMP
jgi:hypothetical protein